MGYMPKPMRDLSVTLNTGGLPVIMSSFTKMTYARFWMYGPS